MIIGGGKLEELSLHTREELILRSQHDVEEISNYGETLNPLNLFLRGSTFFLGHLFLTDARLILLPYSEREVANAQLLQRLAYFGLGEAGLGIPRPKVKFSLDPLVVPLDEISTVNPFRKQFRIHPTLYVFSISRTYRFKFVPTESPGLWTEQIADLADATIEDAAPS